MLTRLSERQQLYKSNVKQITQVLVALGKHRELPGKRGSSGGEQRWSLMGGSSSHTGAAYGRTNEDGHLQSALSKSFSGAPTSQSPFSSYTQARFCKTDESGRKSGKW